MMFIHPTALVEEGAYLSDSVHIGSFCQVETGVILEGNVVLESHVVLKRGVYLEKNVRVHSFACLGDAPQIYPFDPAFESGIHVGARTIIREGVTIHRASEVNKKTTVGMDCLLMAYSHVGHDCHVGNHCILANNALLAGCVTLEDYVFMGGGAMVHQFVHVGESVFVSGNSAFSLHVPPFVTLLDRNQMKNLNVVGLQRRGFSTQEVADIKQCYRRVYQAGNRSFFKNAQKALQEGSFRTEKGRQFLSFFTEERAQRGFIGTLA